MRSILSLVLWLTASAATAQDTYSLSELLNIAFQENYQIQIVRKQEQMAQNMNTAGNAGMLPVVSIGVDHNRDILTSEANLYTGVTRIGDNALSSGFGAMVAVDWTVFDGFSMFARRDRLSLIASMSELDTRYYLEQTAADLAQIYYTLIRERELLASYQKMKEVSLFRLELESKKRSIGSGNSLMYHQAFIDFNADSALVVGQEMQVRALQLDINRYINRNPLNPVLPDGDHGHNASLIEVDDALRMAISHNTYIERAKLEELIAESQVRIERGNSYPSIALFGNYAFSRQTSETGLIESAHSRGPRMGVRVRFNLYNGGQQRTQVMNSNIEVERVGLITTDTQSMIETEIHRLALAHEAYLKQYQIIETSIEAAKSALVIAREQLQAGAINGYEFRQTQLAAIQAENQRTMIWHLLKLTETSIQRITGTLLNELL